MKPTAVQLPYCCGSKFLYALGGVTEADLKAEVEVDNLYSMAHACFAATTDKQGLDDKFIAAGFKPILKWKTGHSGQDYGITLWAYVDEKFRMDQPVVKPIVKKKRLLRAKIKSAAEAYGHKMW